MSEQMKHAELLNAAMACAQAYMLLSEVCSVNDHTVNFHSRYKLQGDLHN